MSIPDPAAAATDPAAAATDLAAPPPPPPKATSLVPVRVLVKCLHGNPDDVVNLPKKIAEEAEKAGQVDAGKAAVTYAQSLPQNKFKSSALNAGSEA